MKVNSILISQPEPNNARSPYYDLSDKFGVKIDFRPFIQVESVSAKEVRRQKVSIPEHTAVIITSRTAIENFFRVAEEMRVEVAQDMKYFCVSEAIALYLQKFITYRKRKVFFPKTKDKSFYDVLLKHKSEKYLFLRSDVSNSDIPDFLDAHKISYKDAIMYRTVCSDLSDLADVNYDIIAFFSPSGIKSLFENFPDFKQNNTRIAAFGSSTKEAVEQANLRLDIEAPTVQAPSMKMALELYLRQANAKK
ncbi:MAG: uroporphyrinogen-III synthase [Bacteroidetes bacterium]|nr:uroporphyrinogen-III synthase [Bacteroidota bacterium]